MHDFGLYAIITEPQLPYDTIAEIFAEEEIAFVQLREKKLSDRKVIDVARMLKKIFKNTQTKLVINDRPDIAMLVEADYLHLGQEDILPEEARFITNNKIPIGLSTHNLIQLKQALKHNPAYVGFGPIFPTTTKEKPDPVVGTEMLKKALKIATIPVVAIGGIFPENIDEVLQTGAKNICMVRYFMQSKTKTELKDKIKFVKNKIKYYDTITRSN
jgi:thiamine-phosphate pyrophosphorylase